MAAVKPIIDLDYPRKDGTTRREHLMQVQQWEVIERETPEIPPCLQHVWEWFWQVVSGKGEDGWWTSLQAWSAMTGSQPSLWEARLMGRLHEAYSKAVSDKVKT